MPDKYRFYPLQFSTADFLDQVKAGVSPRYLPPIMKGSFNGADLSGLDLTGVTFAHIDMQGCNLSN